MNIFLKTMNVENRIDSHVQLGCISIASLDMISPFPLMEERLEELLHERAGDLTEFEDEFRLACRDMLRIGSYKPTGRSRPASEYLLRSATNSSFPRINPVVDLINYISLKYLVPLSLWDMEKVKADSWLFRTVHNEERSEEHTTELQSRGHIECRLRFAKENNNR